MASTPAPTPLLAVSRRKAWHAVIRFRGHLRIGAGVIGAGPGDHTGLRGAEPNLLSCTSARPRTQLPSATPPTLQPGRCQSALRYPLPRSELPRVSAAGVFLPAAWG